VALEETLDEGFVHDGDQLALLVVGGCEGAAANDRHPEILDVVRADAIPRGARLAASHLGRRMAGDENELAPVVREGVVKGQPRALHSWQTIQPFFESSVQRPELRLCVRRRRPVQGDDDAALNLVPEILMLELVQAASEHHRAGNEYYGQRRLDDEQR